MNTVYKNLNDIETPLIICGDPFTKCANVIICITGNPGITDFYSDFIEQLQKNMLLPICLIGHAGHEVHIYKRDNDKLLCGLGCQLKHKLDLIENHIDKDTKIHFIGHSIGAWMIIELLHKNQQLIRRVSSINLLFPTLQRMAESRNGKFVNNVIRKFNICILFLCKLLYLLPQNVLGYLVSMYLLAQSLPFKLKNVIIKLLNPNVVENILFMAFDEMDTVKSLNIDGIHKIKHLTNVIFTSNDSWAPLEYMDDLNQFKPQLQMLESHNVEHAFVLKSSMQVADMVTDFIKKKLNNVF